MDTILLTLRIPKRELKAHSVRWIYPAFGRWNPEKGVERTALSTPQEA